MWSSCGWTAEWALADYGITEQMSLPKAVQETSGLACVNDRLFTVNDSGHPAIIYEINARGDVLAGYKSQANNNDWEAMTAFNDFLYVADIGNNSGLVKQYSIYRHDLLDMSLVKPSLYRQVRFEYTDYPTESLAMMSHDYDAESLAFNGNKLVVFSKSWQSNVARVYEINLVQPDQKATPVTTIDDLPGMITGAHYDEASKRYVVVGYNSNGLPSLKPFMALLSDEYKVLELKSLKGFGQVEAVCLDFEGSLWFSQERALFKPALLVKMMR